MDRNLQVVKMLISNRIKHQLKIGPRFRDRFSAKKTRPTNLAPTVGANVVGSVFVAGKWARNPGPPNQAAHREFDSQL